MNNNISDADNEERARLSLHIRIIITYQKYSVGFTDRNAHLFLLIKRNLMLFLRK